MKNKILIIIYVPAVSEEFEMFISVNITVKKLISQVMKSINDVLDNVLIENNYCLIDPSNSSIYSYNDIIRDTNICNNKRIILI